MDLNVPSALTVPSALKVRSALMTPKGTKYRLLTPSQLRRKHTTSQHKRRLDRPSPTVSRVMSSLVGPLNIHMGNDGSRSF